MRVLTCNIGSKKMNISWDIGSNLQKLPEMNLINILFFPMPGIFETLPIYQRLLNQFFNSNILVFLPPNDCI